MCRNTNFMVCITQLTATDSKKSFISKWILLLWGRVKCAVAGRDLLSRVAFSRSTLNMNMKPAEIDRYITYVQSAYTDRNTEYILTRLIDYYRV